MLAQPWSQHGSHPSYSARTTASFVSACMCWSMLRDRVATSASSRPPPPGLLLTLCDTTTCRGGLVSRQRCAACALCSLHGEIDAHLLLLLHLHRSCWDGADLQHPLIGRERDLHGVVYVKQVLLVLSRSSSRRHSSSTHQLLRCGRSSCMCLVSGDCV